MGPGDPIVVPAEPRAQDGRGVRTQRMAGLERPRRDAGKAQRRVRHDDAAVLRMVLPLQRTARVHVGIVHHLLQVAHRRVLDAAIHAGDDVLPLEARGYSSSGDQCSLSYRLAAPLPADARIVLTLATELVRTQYEFELQAIDWFGRPL